MFRAAAMQWFLPRLLVLTGALGLLLGALAPAAQTPADTPAAAPAGLPVDTTAETTATRSALVLTLDGAVGPASADYLIRGIATAAETGAGLVIIRMDTPGGLVTSTRDIVGAILASPVPVAVHVAPSGARAASAGTFIAQAAHVAAMAPATSIGAATPVTMGGGPFGEPERRPERQPERQPPPQDEAADEGEAPPPAQPRRTTAPGPASAAEAKAINDSVAWIRSLAELRGRNADWAEAAVRDAATLTASAAAEAGVIDFVARTTADLLAGADGMSVDLNGTPGVLQTAGLEAVALDPDWRSRFLSVITDPNIALLLMLVGVYGIVFEILNPGALFPGTIGGISILTGMMALSILPFSWAGLALILLGLALVLAEAFSPSFGVLGIGGAVAIVLGGVLLFDGEVPGLEIHWPALAAVGVGSLMFSALLARLAAVSYRRRVATGAEEMIGLQAKVQDWAQGPDGGRGHVFVHGERWQARGAAGAALVPGQVVTVQGMDGLTLLVAPPDDNRSSDP